ncbi:MAG: type II toxin-antitoxin system RelE/ParE family toxin [Firmicutes bacterium]|nr:type II toxin-antitoxin system RelE/ParE family toxin [Bacillota bacterium]
MSPFPVRIGSAAQHDISDTVTWYEAQRPGLGERFLWALDDLVHRIADNPRQFPVVESQVRRALLPRFPYALYFTVTTDCVVVVAVLHVRRHPKEWQRRV